MQEVTTIHLHCVLRATPDTPVPATTRHRHLLHAPFLTSTPPFDSPSRPFFSPPLPVVRDLCSQGANEITAACLDDRQRKAVTGDSSGVVSVYNCATAMHLKVLSHTLEALAWP